MLDPITSSRSQDLLDVLRNIWIANCALYHRVSLIERCQQNGGCNSRSGIFNLSSTRSANSVHVLAILPTFIVQTKPPRDPPCCSTNIFEAMQKYFRLFSVPRVHALLHRGNHLILRLFAAFLSFVISTMDTHVLEKFAVSVCSVI